MAVDPQFHATLDTVRRDFQALPERVGTTRFQSLKNNLYSSLDSWKQRFSGLRSAVDFRRLMISLVRTLLEKTSRGFTTSGLDQPQLTRPDRGVCFLSNHRSTSLDPILVNYALSTHLSRTAYNAAGDNIFRTPWLGHLIRLNRGFVVKREVEGIDEKLAEAQKLSAYINGLLDQKEWVWIAHRNGRSKDGSDRTDSAVLAMLKKSRGEPTWEEWSTRAALMPVCMSYELIPLDLHMAVELTGGAWHTGQHRDMKNIYSEIMSEKGRMHLAFCPPVSGATRTALVEQIDRGIHGAARLFESNLLAYVELGLASLEEETRLRQDVDLEKGRWVLDRKKDLPEEARLPFLKMYSAPVVNAVARRGSLEKAVALQGPGQMTTVPPALPPPPPVP